MFPRRGLPARHRAGRLRSESFGAIRAAIALLFAVPAAVAGYHATLGLADLLTSSGRRRVEAFAAIGPIAAGRTAWARMTLFAPSNGPSAPLCICDQRRVNAPFLISRMDVLSGDSFDRPERDGSSCGRCSLSLRHCRPPFCTPAFLFLRPQSRTSCADPLMSATSSPEDAVRRATPPHLFLA